MAKVTIQTHNVTVPYSSGQETFQVAYEGCTGVSVTSSNASLVLASVTLDSSGNIVVVWNENTSGAGKASIITLTASDGVDEYIDRLAFNQLGSTYNVTLTGPEDIEGDSGTSTYLVSSTANGTYSALSEDGWLRIDSITKSGTNSGNMVLKYTRNTADPRVGTVLFTFNFSDSPYRAYTNIIITQGMYVPEPEPGPEPGPDTGATRFYYEPNAGNVSYASGTFTSPAPILENVSGLTVRNVSGTMDITSVDIDENTGRLIIKYNANPGDEPLNATISLRATGPSGYVNTTFYLYQASYQYVVNPIWKTTEVEVSGKIYIDYRLISEGKVIYSGRAYRMPGEESINFSLNEIVRDYVDNTLWWREGYQTPSGWERAFTLDMSGSDGVDYIFTKDWSYTELGYADNDLICLNEPIINTIPEGCFVPVCVFSPQRAGNTSFIETNTQGVASTAYTVNLDNPRQARYLFTAENGYKYGLSGEGMNKSDIYEGTDRCFTPFVLYYENAYGGIDALPIQGKVTASDKITSYTTRNAVTVPSRDFAYRRYLNDINKSWELNTKYLSDLQASRMHHLIESTLVYLYDVAADAVYPVVIDENSLTYKTYKNQGRKFFNYTFKVRESQNKIRK